MITSRQCLRLPETTIFFFICCCLFPSLREYILHMECGGDLQWSGWNFKGNLLILSSGLYLLYCANLQTVNTNIPGKYSDSLKCLSYYPAWVLRMHLDWGFLKPIFSKTDSNMKVCNFQVFVLKHP